MVSRMPADVPSRPDFQLGERYLRRELHDEFGGQRQHGISTPATEPFVFIFTDPSSEEHGYHDQFLSNGLFIYSGEGQVGDMAIDRGNRRILEHQQNEETLYVFEVVGEQNGADIVTYDGEYEYVDHYWERAPDDHGDMRDALRFKLLPVGGLDSDVSEDELKNASLEQLFGLAKERGAVGGTSTTSGSGSPGSSTGVLRTELVRDFALAAANGVCQGCQSDAPFLRGDGKPFLEVHHLHRISDGGVDDPENVIAICPNCHREVHYGQEGDDLNETLIEKAAERNERFR